eukprot:g36389.t1
MEEEATGPQCANLSGYVEGILKPIVQRTPSFRHSTTDFLQKLSTHRLVEPGTFLITVDVSVLYTSIVHNDGIAATASVPNTNNYQFPDDILQLIHFILDHHNFIFDNQFFIQTHGTAMGTKFVPQYAKIFMYKFEQDFFVMQELQPTLYIRYIDDIFFLWTHATNHNVLLRRQTWDMTDRVTFDIQYIPRVEKLRHVLRSLQHIDDEHLAKIVPMSPLLAFKQPPNLQQTIARSKLPSLQSDTDHNTTQPCHRNLCKTCQIIDMDTTIT